MTETTNSSNMTTESTFRKAPMKDILTRNGAVRYDGKKIHESLSELRMAAREEDELPVGTRTLEISVVYLPDDFNNAEDKAD